MKCKVCGNDTDFPACDPCHRGHWRDPSNGVDETKLDWPQERVPVLALTTENTFHVAFMKNGTWYTLDGAGFEDEIAFEVVKWRPLPPLEGQKSSASIQAHRIGV